MTSSLRWGDPACVRTDAPAELRPGSLVGVLSGLGIPGIETVEIEYLTDHVRRQISWGWLEVVTDEEWFARLGMPPLRVEMEDGRFWVSLGDLVQRYGSGSSRGDAIESARRRYFVEQLGSEAERRPRRPLP